MKTKKKIYWVLGQRIKRKRRQQNYTQTDLSKMLKLTRTSISNIEAGTQAVSVETIYKLSSLFECPIWDFLPSDIAIVDSEADNLAKAKVDKLKEFIKGLK